MAAGMDAGLDTGLHAAPPVLVDIVVHVSDGIRAMSCRRRVLADVAGSMLQVSTAIVGPATVYTGGVISRNAQPPTTASPCHAHLRGAWAGGSLLTGVRMGDGSGAFTLLLSALPVNSRSPRRLVGAGTPDGDGDRATRGLALTVRGD